MHDEADIVNHLRAWAMMNREFSIAPTILKAADEIERLRVYERMATTHSCDWELSDGRPCTKTADEDMVSPDGGEVRWTCGTHIPVAERRGWRYVG